MWAWALMPSLAATAARSTMRDKPGAVSGAPRSDTEHEGRAAAFPLMATQLPQLPARQRMPAGSTVLDSPDAQGRAFEVHLLPT